jgi:hypothetical protein
LKQKKTGLIIVSVVAALLIVVSTLGFIVFSGNKSNPKGAESTALPEGATPQITLQQVSTHNTASDCWTIIDQSVYDISRYVSNHPGGSVIVQACGTVGTELFKNRVDESGDSKGSHSKTAKNLLENYRIGILAP